MDGTYYVIRDKNTGEHVTTPGLSAAPHLYLSEGKANGQRKRMWKMDNYEVVPVSLNVIKKGA